MGKLYGYVEGKTYELNQIPEKFIMSGYFSEISKDRYILKVCGVANIDNKNYLFFPKAYNENKSDAILRKTGKNLFHVLLKYRESIRLSDEELDWLGDKNKNIQYLNTIEWLINDYTINGLYKVSERIIEENGKGRVEWSRTIKAKKPYIIGNEFSYLDLMTSKNNIHSDHIISQIHEKVILQCIKDLGWLFGMQYSEKTIELEVGENQQIIILKKKLRETYTAREIKLLQNLIAIIDKRMSNNSDLVIVTPYFYAVWEEMLKLQLGHDETLNGLVPKPYWHIGNKKSYTRQIPDILIRHKNDLVILDAKYYSTIKEYGSESEDLLAHGHFPGWESVVKQMYYNLSLKDRGFNNIKNIFLMPQSLMNNQEISYVGYTGVEEKEDTFGYVLAFALDIDVVLEDYIANRNRNEDLFVELIDAVNEQEQVLRKARSS